MQLRKPEDDFDRRNLSGSPNGRLEDSWRRPREITTHMPALLANTKSVGNDGDSSIDERPGPDGPDVGSSISGGPKSRVSPSSDKKRTGRSLAQESLQIDEMVDRYHAQLFGFAFRLTGNNADAEDVTQQTFLSAVEHLGQLRDPSKIKSWLMVTLKNCFLKLARRRRPASESSLSISVDQLAVYELDESALDSEQLQQALNQLADDHRLILTMFYFQQMSYREIAELLEIQLGTVMSRLARAKSKLRGLLLDKAGADHG